tara:strand:+ start:1002 stop:1169 length:168 start_codon:yes stop_codon:yes gene_type:complete
MSEDFINLNEHSFCTIITHLGALDIAVLMVSFFTFLFVAILKDCKKKDKMGFLTQ